MDRADPNPNRSQNLSLRKVNRSKKGYQNQYKKETKKNKANKMITKLT